MKSETDEASGPEERQDRRNAIQNITVTAPEVDQLRNSINEIFGEIFIEQM